MSARQDFLKYVRILNVACLSVAVFTAMVLAWENAALRNLSLATATFVAVVLSFLIQLPFELQRSQEVDHVSTEFTVDRSAPWIRQWNYTGTPAWRMGTETGASTWIVANNAEAFKGDRELLNADFAIYSLLCFFTIQEFDWQLRKQTYRSRGFGTGFAVHSISKDNECTAFTEEDVRAVLARSGNIFAGAPLRLFSGKWRLPAKSTVEVSRKSITIQNPVCRVLCYFDDSPAVLSHVKPGTGGQAPTLASGEPQLETRMTGFTIEVTYFALRSQTPDITKYRDWVSRIRSDAHEWFESSVDVP
jgi:hypothetical protein